MIVKTETEAKLRELPKLSFCEQPSPKGEGAKDY
jgi:hypothetical protein